MLGCTDCFSECSGHSSSLSVACLLCHVAAQSFLKPEYAIISEVGDSWFNTQKLRLPNGAAYEIQVSYRMQAGLEVHINVLACRVVSTIHESERL
jgi:hypothetical protein